MGLILVTTREEVASICDAVHTAIVRMIGGMKLRPRMLTERVTERSITLNRVVPEALLLDELEEAGASARQHALDYAKLLQVVRSKREQGWISAKLHVRQENHAHIAKHV